MKKLTLSLCLASALSVGALVHGAAADPPPVYAPIPAVYQPPQPDPLVSVGSIVAFASTAGASHVGKVALVPVDALACDADDYRTLYIVDVDAAGDAAPALYTGTTTCAGSGDWSAGVAAFTILLAYDLPAGHTLAAMWRSSGAGTALPGGAWRVE